MGRPNYVETEDYRVVDTSTIGANLTVLFDVFSAGIPFKKAKLWPVTLEVVLSKSSTAGTIAQVMKAKFVSERQRLRLGNLGSGVVLRDDRANESEWLDVLKEELTRL